MTARATSGEHEASASEPARRSRSAARRIAVIGGGLSGLSAALRLRDAGFDGDVTLFEASGRLGGLIETVHQDGFLIERGADSFITTKPAAVRLCERLGIGNRLVRPNEANRRSLIVRNGAPVPTPDDFHLCVPRNVTAVLDSGLLSTAGQLRFLREPTVPPRTGDGDESLASFCTRRFGRETLDRIVQPIAAGIYSADPAELSMDATMPQFPALERTHGSLTEAGRVARRSDREAASGARYGLFATLPGGLGEMVGALADAVRQSCEVRLRSAVGPIERAAAGWLVAGGRFDAVVVALPARVAATLLPGVPDLGGIPASSSAVFTAGYRRDQFDHPLNAFGMVVPFTERSPVTAVSFASNKFPGRAPDGHVLVRVFVGGPHGKSHLSSGEAIRSAAVGGLRSFLGLRGSETTSLTTPYPAASPQYTIGHADRVARIDVAVRDLPRVALAGASYRGVGIPDAVASGERAADDLLRESE